jgi:hypothetical protein
MILYKKHYKTVSLIHTVIGTLALLDYTRLSHGNLLSIVVGGFALHNLIIFICHTKGWIEWK